jgi:hypothetical protein
VTQPAAARAVKVAVHVADRHRVEREVRLGGELPGRLAPRVAVIAGDQEEAPRSDEVLDRASVAVLLVDPGMRQGRAWPGGGQLQADVVDRCGDGAGIDVATDHEPLERKEFVVPRVDRGRARPGWAGRTLPP